MGWAYSKNEDGKITKMVLNNGKIYSKILSGISRMTGEYSIKRDNYASIGCKRMEKTKEGQVEWRWLNKGSQGPAGTVMPWTKDKIKMKY